MNKVKTIYKKEFLDVLRDRRTLISMIVVPLLLIPLMTVGMSTIVGSQLKKTKAETHKIAIEGADNYPRLSEYIASTDGLEVVSVDDYKSAIADKSLGAAVVIPESAATAVEMGDSAVVKIYYDAAEIKSQFARNRITKSIAAFKDSVVSERLKVLGADVHILNPISVRTENVASEEKMSGYALAIFLPYIIIILTMVGAMYPAIDLTAGEKERGTLETILASPASRMEIAAGKFLTIFTASMITALISLISLTLTAKIGMANFEAGSSDIAFKIQPLSFIVLLLLMLPISCLFSATLMTISLFAKSYKEAQSYLTPAMMVVIIPSMISFVPGIELNFKLALVPIVNISLVAKEALMGNIQWGYIGLVFLSTAVLASLSVFIAKRQFDREEVLFRI